MSKFIATFHDSVLQIMYCKLNLSSIQALNKFGC